MFIFHPSQIFVNFWDQNASQLTSSIKESSIMKMNFLKTLPGLFLGVFGGYTYKGVKSS
jgi:hypothetical protein